MVIIQVTFKKVTVKSFIAWGFYRLGLLSPGAFVAWVFCRLWFLSSELLSLRLLSLGLLSLGLLSLGLLSPPHSWIYPSLYTDIYTIKPSVFQICLQNLHTNPGIINPGKISSIVIPKQTICITRPQGRDTQGTSRIWTSTAIGYYYS